VIALRAYGTGERRDPTGIMREIGKTLSEDEMRALAAYAENLSGEASGAGGSRPATSP
jgi:cytochrome c553